MRFFGVILLVGGAALGNNGCVAFQQQSPWRPSRRRILCSTELAGVASKPPRGSRQEEKGKPNVWDNFKRTVYRSVDGVNDLTSKITGDGENKSSGVSDGYSVFEQTVKKGAGPASKLMSEYKARASALGVDKELAPSSKSKSKPRTSFDSFKENLYSASDAFGAISSPKPEPTPLDKLERSIPYKKSLIQELGVDAENVEDLLSDNPVKRFQAQQEIREREARRRVELRNERIRAKKEDLYKVVDAMQAAVDSFPETIDKTEKVIKETIKTVKTVPSKVEKVVEEVKALPLSVQKKADETKQSLEATIDQTKRAVEEVIDIPNKVSKKAEDTKKAVLDTKESIEEGVTNVKVLLRLEKPKPKPPKLPPPKPKTAKEIALSIAGSAAKGAAQATWWVAKSAATAAWDGASSAIRERQQTSSNQQEESTTSSRNKAREQAAELQKEVDEALRLADETLKKVDEQ